MQEVKESKVGTNKGGCLRFMKLNGWKLWALYCWWVDRVIYIFSSLSFSNVSLKESTTKFFGVFNEPDGRNKEVGANVQNNKLQLNKRDLAPVHSMFFFWSSSSHWNVPEHFWGLVQLTSHLVISLKSMIEQLIIYWTLMTLPTSETDGAFYELCTCAIKTHLNGCGMEELLHSRRVVSSTHGWNFSVIPLDFLLLHVEQNMETLWAANRKQRLLPEIMCMCDICCRFEHKHRTDGWRAGEQEQAAAASRLCDWCTGLGHF